MGGSIQGLRRYAVTAVTVAMAFLAGSAQATPPTSVDLSRYVRVGRYDLPEPTRTTPPANSLLCQEASSVTYNWDTDTLFVVGDGGTSVVQVSKTGQLINSMTLAPGSSPQGTDFYDTEGITYVGNGKLVLMEERYRQANLFTYVAGGTLHHTDAQSVKLGTTVGNIGLEGISYDPYTGGFLCVKEKDPESIFQTGIDFVAGTATNGSSTTTNSVDLFNPSLVNTADFSDVFALSNLPSLNGQPDYTHFLIISQESGQVVQLDRSGNVYSRLTIVADPGSPLSVPDMTMEGVTMDRDGFLYIVNENGGGDANHPQLWVYAPSAGTNTAPTGVSLLNAVPSIPENTSTAAAIKVADISIADDGLGTNNITLAGADANSFQVIGIALYLKAGTALNASTKPTYNVTINVDDPTVGNTPDATTSYTLNVTASTGGTPSIIISEVAPWSSGNSPLGADWFEVTNVGTAAANITGWKMDDNSHSFGSAVALNGITSIAPGESVIFIEGSSASLKTTFLSLWFGSNPPANLQVGLYSGSGVGLSTGGDEVNLYDSTGVLQASVGFGTSPSSSPFATFDNATGLNGTTISALSASGVHGGFVAAGDSSEIGSPGTIGASTTPIVTITAPNPNAAEAGNVPGTFRVARTGSTVNALTVNYTIATGAGQATSADYTPTLTGVVTIPSGQSTVDITITPVDDAIFEGPETVTLTLGDTGSYDVGSPATATVTIADNETNQPPSAVVLNNAANPLPDTTNTVAAVKIADIAVTDDAAGTNNLSVSGNDAASFQIIGTALYLKAGTTLNYAIKSSYSVTVNVDDPTVGTTPDASVNLTLAVVPGSIVITEVHPTGSSASYGADWFEVTNTGTSSVDITGWQMDDNSNGTAKVALRGVTSIPAGKSVIFFEGTATGNTDSTITGAFCNAWFGSSTPPAGFLIGAYGGSGVGLSSSGDAVNLFDAAGNRVTGVAFGTATNGVTFDNKAGLGSTTLPLPVISTLSTVGTNGAFHSADNAEVGSPGALAPLQAWRVVHFHTFANSGLTADTADYDGDAVSNIVEYALGLDPANATGTNGSDALPAESIGEPEAELADRLALVFATDNPAPSDVTCMVEATSDLTNWSLVASNVAGGAWTWQGGGASHIVQVAQGSRQLVKVGDLVPRDAAHPVRMMRLKVTSP